MKALILKGKHAGEEVKISQWCNDWFTIDSKDVELATQPLSPTSLAFTKRGMDIIKAHNNNGVMFDEFEPVRTINYGAKYQFTFKRRKRAEEPPRKFLNPKQAKELVRKRGKEAHVFHNPAGILVGFDVSLARIHKAMDTAESIEVGGEQCLGMGHAIVIIPKKAKLHADIWFVEHDQEKIKKYL